MPSYNYAVASHRPLWQTCLILLLAPLLMCGLVWGLWSRWQQDERDRRAPVVFARPAGGCTLSPGGRFLAVGADSLQAGDFVDADTGAIVHVPLAAALQRATGPSLWLRGETLFFYTEWTPDPTDHLINIPQNGWLIDVANRVVTDVLTLDPPARQATLALARQRVQAQFTGGLPAPSPDGRFIYNDYVDIAAITTPSHDVRNRIRTWRSIQACIPGWRPDSRGYYVIDRTRVGLFGVGPGPIRLLLVDPPPRPWTQYAPSVVTALLLTVGGWWWRHTVRQLQADT